LAAQFALGVLKSTPTKYLEKHCPFRSLKKNHQLVLSKLTRFTHKPPSIERQIRTELNNPARPFPSPVHTNLNSKALSAAASKQLEFINHVEIDQLLWQPPRPIQLVIDQMAKLEAKREKSNFLSSINADKDLVIYTDGSAHPKEGLGEAAVTADGVFSKL
jgi:hypothetical protein